MNPRPNFDINALLGITRQNIHVPLEAGGGMWFSAYFGQAPRMTPSACVAATTPRRPKRSGRHSSSIRRSREPRAAWRSTIGSARGSRSASPSAMIHQRRQRQLHRTHGAGAAPILPEPDRPGGRQDQSHARPQHSTVDYSGTIRANLFNIGTNTSFGAQYFRSGKYTVQARGEEFPTAGLETVAATARNFGNEADTTNATLGFFVQEQLKHQGPPVPDGRRPRRRQQCVRRELLVDHVPEGRRKLGHRQRGGVVQPAGDQLAQAARRIRPNGPAAGDVLGSSHLRRRRQR